MLKAKFEFNNQNRNWEYYPFIITESQYRKINWEVLQASFDLCFKNLESIEAKSKKALHKYAKKIQFFSKNEYNDLKFDLFDIELNILNSKIVGFKASYGVDEDENSKIFWKDLYGIWNVYFENLIIIKVERQ